MNQIGEHLKINLTYLTITWKIGRVGLSELKSHSMDNFSAEIYFTKDELEQRVVALNYFDINMFNR